MAEISNMEGLLDGLRDQMPVAQARYDMSGQRSGLVIVDVVNGFATVGAGPLAPPAPNPQVAKMIAESNRLARRFAEAGWPILAFLDTHEPGRPEPPYPPHCERGSGQEELVAELAWLTGSPHALLVRKDCINGFVGAEAGGRNRLADWCLEHRLEALVVVGICTDICVMDLVLTLLSARNHGLLGGLDDVVVFEPACATYDLSADAARSLNLPVAAAHPQDAAHHLGLYFMASRGAVIAAELD